MSSRSQSGFAKPVDLDLVSDRRVKFAEYSLLEPAFIVLFDWLLINTGSARYGFNVVSSAFTGCEIAAHTAMAMKNIFEYL